MYVGQNTRPTKEIVCYILITLLVEGCINSDEVKNKFNISTKTFYRYMSFIKLMLSDYDFYYIDIYYDRKNNQHICVSNTLFKSSKTRS